MSRHFEKKGALGLFRRFSAKGSTFQLAFGEASKFTIESPVKCRSAAEAARMVGTWSRWALEAGFAEVPIGAGTLGILFHLEAPLGPGRVRDDEGRNVYFDADACAASSLKQGQRVVLEGVKRNPRLEVAFMFDSKLQAKRLVASPVPVWSRFKATPDLDAKTRERLLVLAGPAIGGCQERKGTLAKTPIGSLIFAYERGVHRLLKRDKGADAYFVFSEAVLTSKLTRAVSTTQLQVEKFCAPIPAALRRELEQRLGLGAKPAKL